MEGRIAHLRSHYRVVGAQVAAPAVASRLDRILREDVVRNYGEALQSALAGDESVYVLRRVKTSTRVVLSAGSSDAVLAKSWASHLAAAVMRAIAGAEDDPGNLVRFENQADYVASFLVALLKDSQQDQWFFETFAEVNALDKKTAIRRVLLDNISHNAAILAYVHRYGEIDSLIAALDAETKRILWSPKSEQRDDLEVSRSLFTAALQLLEKLGGWTRPPRNTEKLFQSYWETAPPFADWRDPRSLAESVFEVVRYFFARGYLAGPEAGELSFRLNEALENFEWLDREWLSSSVLKLFDKQEQTTPDLPLRVASGRATPRQRELLAAIAGAMTGDKSSLAEIATAAHGGTSSLAAITPTTPGDASSPAAIAGAAPGDMTSLAADPLSAALKILALLVNAAPGWAEDSAAKVLIENLLTIRTVVQQTAAREEFVKRLQCRDVEGALQLLPLDQRERVRTAARSVASLGEPALALVEKLSNTEVKASIDGVESEYAGSSLLLRTVLDARLHTLADEAALPAASEWPRSVMLFLLVALRVGRENAFVNGSLEEGLCLLAGLEQAPTLDALHARWRESEDADHARFQKSLLRIVAGQRLLEPATMHVFQVSLTNGTQAVVAADESEMIWPLACVIDAKVDVGSVVSDWQSAWEDVTGVAPRVVVDDCPNGRDAFLEALKILDQGQTGNPKLDLTATVVTCLLLRMWARWLRGFSTSSVPFLIENFIRRPGRLHAEKNALLVEFERRPLDVVMEMAGYLSDLERVPWLPGGRLKFSVKGA